MPELGPHQTSVLKQALFPAYLLGMFCLPGMPSPCFPVCQHPTGPSQNFLTGMEPPGGYGLPFGHCRMSNTWNRP